MLSPADRTVGQLVAETIRLFGGRFWPSLALGLVVATFDQLALGQDGRAQATLLVLASPFFTLAYIGACAIASGERHPRRAFLTAFLIGVVVFAACCARSSGCTSCRQSRGSRSAGSRFRLRCSNAAASGRRCGAAVSSRRPTTLTRSDRWRRSSSSTSSAAAHCCSSLHGQADATLRTAAFLADLVLSPMLFLGSAAPVFRPEGPVRVGLPTTKEARCPSTSC